MTRRKPDLVEYTIILVMLSPLLYAAWCNRIRSEKELTYLGHLVTLPGMPMYHFVNFLIDSYSFGENLVKSIYDQLSKLKTEENSYLYYGDKE